MELRFYIDPESGLPHIHRHDVSESEVTEVLGHPGEHRRGVESSWIAVGQTRAGRYLKVIYVPDPGADAAFVITSCPLGRKALKAFKRRRRRAP